MITLKELALGIVQGATEFLPISSSGHLGLFSKLIDVPSNLSFFAFLHLGTFLAVFTLLWRDVVSIIRGITKNERESWLLAVKIVAASAPAALVGIFLESLVEEAFASQRLIGALFLLTAVVLLLSDRLAGRKTLRELTIPDALVVGLFQACAVLPGLSRSGLTLFGALLVGLNRADAFRFSFLLSLPVTLGAGLLEFGELTLGIGTLVGFVGALVSGLLSLAFLRRVTLNARLRYFSLYLLVPALVSFFVP